MKAYKKLQLLVSFIFLVPIVLFSIENKTIESQPQILFEHKNLKDGQTKRELLIKFNTAVLYLEQEKYQHAIALLKQSAKLLKIPSYLNIGIAYYKLKSNKNAYLYLKKIYDFKELQFKDKYSYFSACYYLYKLTNDKKYIEEITSISIKAKRLTAHEKILLVDTLILQKKYKYALETALTIKTISKLKIALIYIKLRDYTNAKMYLEKATVEVKGDIAKNEVLWFQLFRNLKANDMVGISDTIVKIEDRKKIFKINKELKIELFFNKNKFTPKEYFEKITDLSYDQKLDFMYYFAPFIFEDYDVMSKDETKGFIIKNQNSISELNMMIQYNADFLNVVKFDSIKRVQMLQAMIDEKFDTKAYEYYNLGLSYAQIYDYNNAYKYFKKAYDLDHGNKLYSVMTFLTIKRLNIFVDKVYKEFLVKNIMSKNGSYNYISKYLYKIFEDSSTKLDKKRLTVSQKKSIFFRALYFLSNVKKNGILKTEPLIVEFSKDPLVYLLSLIAREKNENEYLYISRIQDNLPKIYNNTFLKGSLVITDYYLDTLRALGLFNRTDFNIEDENTPSYLRTKAIVSLYRDKPNEAIDIIENIQNRYNLRSIDTYYILAAALFSSGQKELAYATLSEIELLYSDKDAKFLSGIRLIQDMKLNSALQYFQYKLNGKLIDFRLKNFDNFLESI
ncbi:MAG: hypothetical protein U9N59_00725 [Campylobacterota bacterium]|nr:hypothetical protein [Campylobacterota bacterium]